MAAHSLEQAKQLLEAARAIASHQAQIARLSGANFNVFRLLRMEEDEVRLHSQFIAELLDPKGSHEQGSAFLEMFLKQVECSRRIDADKARVEREHYIGRVDMSDADPTGGRIDVFITDGTRHISIENKIHHDEGDHQVDRYCNYKPESNFVLFLTLDGREAHTAKKNKHHHAPISYAAHIVPWLERCHKHCADLPVLRESIKQYLVVVRELTGGDPLMQGTNEEAKRLLRQNMEAAHLVYRHFMPTIYEAIGEFARSLEREIKLRLDPSWKTQNSSDRRGDRRVFSVEVWSEAWPDRGEKWWVRWQYQQGRFEYGLLNPDRKGRDEIESRLGEGLGEVKSCNDDWWAYYKRMDIPNLEDDVSTLAKLFHEGEQAVLVDEVASKLVVFTAACDRGFKGPAS